MQRPRWFLFPHWIFLVGVTIALESNHTPGWESNHTALWEPLSFSITPSQSKTFYFQLYSKLQWVHSEEQRLQSIITLPCCGYFGPVWSILIHLSAANRINRLSFSLSRYSKRLRGKQLNCFTQLPLHPHSAYKRHYVSSINLAPNDVDVVSVVSRSLSISNWQPARFTGSEVDLKWIWLCFPITALSLDKPTPRCCNKHIIAPIWHMSQIYSCGSTCIL